MNKRHRILLVDDDQTFLEIAASFLGERFEVITATSGEEAIRLAGSESPDLVLLDLHMKGMDGITACEHLRWGATTRSIPVLMTTGRSDTLQKVRAFRAGADDFVEKPFDADELLARIESKLRRFEEIQADRIPRRLQCGNLVLDQESKEAVLDGKRVPLTLLEFRLLHFLAQNRGKLKSRQEIVQAVWDDSSIPDRILDPHILALRKKLTRFDHRISTVYGGGYILKPSLRETDSPTATPSADLI